MWEMDYKESWALKIWCFWTVVLEKTLESALDSKEIQPVRPKGNQSWIFTGRLMLKLKLQYFGHLMRRTDTLENTLTLGKIEGGRRRGRQRMRWLDGISDSMDMSLVNSGSWWWTGRPGMLQFMGLQRVRHNWANELNWTEQSSNPQKLINNLPHEVLKTVHLLVSIHQDMSLYWEKNTTLLFCFCLLLPMGMPWQTREVGKLQQVGKPSSAPVFVQLASTELFSLFQMWLAKIKCHDMEVIWNSNFSVGT